MNRQKIDNLEQVLDQIHKYVSDNQETALNQIRDYFNLNTVGTRPIFNVIKGYKDQVTIEVFTSELDMNNEFYEEDQYELQFHVVSSILDHFLNASGLKLGPDSELFLIECLAESIYVYDKKDHVDYN